MRTITISTAVFMLLTATATTLQATGPMGTDTGGAQGPTSRADRDGKNDTRDGRNARPPRGADRAGRDAARPPRGGSITGRADRDWSLDAEADRERRRMNAVGRINQMNRSLEDELSVLLRQRSDAAWDRQLPGYGALSHRDATIRMGQLDTRIRAVRAQLDRNYRAGNIIQHSR